MYSYRHSPSHHDDHGHLSKVSKYLPDMGSMQDSHYTPGHLPSKRHEKAQHDMGPYYGPYPQHRGSYTSSLSPSSSASSETLNAILPPTPTTDKEASTKRWSLTNILRWQNDRPAAAKKLSDSSSNSHVVDNDVEQQEYQHRYCPSDYASSSGNSRRSSSGIAHYDLQYSPDYDSGPESMPPNASSPAAWQASGRPAAGPWMRNSSHAGHHRQAHYSPPQAYGRHPYVPPSADLDCVDEDEPKEHTNYQRECIKPSNWLNPRTCQPGGFLFRHFGLNFTSLNLMLMLLLATVATTMCYVSARHLQVQVSSRSHQLSVAREELRLTHKDYEFSARELANAREQLTVMGTELEKLKQAQSGGWKEAKEAGTKQGQAQAQVKAQQPQQQAKPQQGKTA